MNDECGAMSAGRVGERQTAHGGKDWKELRWCLMLTWQAWYDNMSYQRRTL